MVISKAPNHRGTTVVEFALVLPFFLMLIFAIVDFGWYFFVQHTLQFATREGTRLGQVLSGDPETRKGAIITKIQENASLAILAINLDKLHIYIYKVGSDPEIQDAGAPGDYMRVRTTYTYQSLTPMIGPLLKGKTIEAEALYRNELFE